MRNLVLSSLLLLLFGGCSVSRLNDFERIPETSVDRNNIQPWFRGDTNRFLFRTHVDIYRNHLGGLMLIKPVHEEDYRVLFITEVGIKVLDMEFLGSGDFKLHYCIDALNRKSVLETLKNDIDLLLSPVPESTKIKMMKDRQTGNILIKSKERRSVTYYFLEDHYRVNKAMRRNGCMKKTQMTIYSTGFSEIDSIHICHSPVKLNIYLSKLNENKSEISE